MNKYEMEPVRERKAYSRAKVLAGLAGLAAAAALACAPRKDNSQEFSIEDYNKNFDILYAQYRSLVQNGEPIRVTFKDVQTGKTTRVQLSKGQRPPDDFQQTQIFDIPLIPEPSARTLLVDELAGQEKTLLVSNWDGQERVFFPSSFTEFTPQNRFQALKTVNYVLQKLKVAKPAPNT